MTHDSLDAPNTSKAGAHTAVDKDYDAICRRTALTDQAGAVTGFVYHERNLVTSRADPDHESPIYLKTWYRDSLSWSTCMDAVLPAYRRPEE